MPELRDRSSEPAPSAAVARRAGALIGALIAATALLAFAAWRGGLDWPAVAIAFLAVGAAVLIGALSRPRSRKSGPRRPTGSSTRSRSR